MTSRTKVRRMVICLFLALLTACGVPEDKPAPGASGLGDPYFPGLGNGGYDARHYSIELTVDVAGNRVEGVTTMEAQATQSLSSFNLDLCGLEVVEVAVDDSPADYSRQEAELTITPTHPIANGQTFATYVAYEGSPGPSGLWFYSMPSGWVQTKDGIFVYPNAGSASTWFPHNEHFSDKAVFTLQVTVPKPYTVVSSGTLLKATDNGEQRTYTWESQGPIASAHLGLDIRQYLQKANEWPNGMTGVTYHPPAMPEGHLRHLDPVPEIIEYLSALFGPFPYKALGVTLNEGISPLAISLPSRLIMSTEQVMDPLLLSHEIAHQWFGSSVSPAFYKDFWLAEGPATYAEALWLEHSEPADVERHIESFALQAQYGSLPPADPFRAGTLDATSMYYRGAMALHALRQQVGDEQFFLILKTFLERFEGGEASTADFIAVAEEISGQELDGFFEAWLYAEEMPPAP